MELHERIRQLRIEKGYNLTELARRADLSVPYLSEIERGKVTPSMRSVVALASALELTLLELLRGVDFAGAPDREDLPPGLAELARHPDFGAELDDDWLALLRGIRLRNRRPQTMREWLVIYLFLREMLYQKV
jgi:transcriptional regulator with XRE-family HTH domain